MGTATQQQPSAYDAAWRRHHPLRARDERQFRLEAVERQRSYARRDKMSDRGTPETLQKVRGVSQGAIARLVTAGHLSADQLGWACEIRTVAQKIGADVAIGTVSLETRVDGGRRGDGSFFEKLGAVRAEVAYGAWRKELGRDALAILAVVVQDEACRPVARKAGMRDATLQGRLSEALDAWPLHYRDARDAIDEDDLQATHAALF